MMIDNEGWTLIWDKGGDSIRAQWKHVFDLETRQMVSTTVREQSPEGNENVRMNNVLQGRGSTLAECKAFVDDVYWLLRNKETKLYFNQYLAAFRPGDGLVPKSEAHIYASTTSGIPARLEWVDQNGKVFAEAQKA